MEISDFNHVITEVVKFHEVDLLGVCNNAVYFNYFEDARIKYLQDLKNQFNLTEILAGNSFFIMARNECDYMESAQFDDELSIYTKINFVKNSSFGFNHLVVNKKRESIIAKGGGVVVHFDKLEHKSIPLPKEFYDAVIKFEKSIEIIK